MQRFFILVCIILCSAVSRLSIQATGTTTSTGSITIRAQYKNEFVLGGNLLVYQVAISTAELNDQTLVLQAPFQTSGISLNQADLDQYARQYTKDLLVYTNQTAPYREVSDIQGDVELTDLPKGLYLLVQTQAAQGYEIMAPFLVTIPYQGTNHVEIFEKMSPKKIKKEEVVTPDKQPNKNKVLPQTGHNWWSVYLLGGLGLGLISLSFVRVKPRD